MKGNSEGRRRALRFMRRLSRPPDWVAFPRNEEQLEQLIELADTEGAALVPFGGGTSVCGGGGVERSR